MGDEGRQAGVNVEARPLGARQATLQLRERCSRGAVMPMLSPCCICSRKMPLPAVEKATGESRRYRSICKPSLVWNASASEEFVCCRGCRSCRSCGLPLSKGRKASSVKSTSAVRWSFVDVEPEKCRPRESFRETGNSGFRFGPEHGGDHPAMV